MPTHAIPMPPLSHRQCQQAETIIHTDQQTQDSLQQTSALLLETKNLLSQQRADYYDRSRQTALANEARVASLQEAVERLQMEVEDVEKERVSWMMKARAYQNNIKREQSETTKWKRIACKYQKDHSPVSTKEGVPG